MFDYPTPKALAAYVALEMGGTSASQISHDPSSQAVLGRLQDTDVMVIDAIVPRLASREPCDNGDGFHVDAVPFSRWDADTSKASQRLGARFARCVCSLHLLKSAWMAPEDLLPSEKSLVILSLTLI